RPPGRSALRTPALAYLTFIRLLWGDANEDRSDFGFGSLQKPNDDRLTTMNLVPSVRRHTSLTVLSADNVRLHSPLREFVRQRENNRNFPDSCVELDVLRDKAVAVSLWDLDKVLADD
ncbi:unnamed protein product, partial [Symbiodinium necroappetens]